MRSWKDSLQLANLGELHDKLARNSCMILPAGVPETNLFSFLMEASCGKQHVDSNSKPQLRWAADIQLQDLSVEGTSHLSGRLRLWECPCGRGKGRGIFLSLRPMTYIDLYWPIVLNPQKPWGGWFFLWFKAFVGFWCFFVGWFFQPVWLRGSSRWHFLKEKHLPGPQDPTRS